MANPLLQPTYTLVDAYCLFELDNRARRLSPRTVQHYRFHLERFITWSTGRNVATIGDVTPAHLRAYLVHLQDAGDTAWTVHGTARSLRRFFRFLVDEELLTKSPMARVKMPQLPKHIMPAFTAGEVDQLLTVAKTARDRALVLFLLDSGVRASECAALDLKHVDFKSGAVYVRDGKGSKDRIVFVGAKTSKAITKYRMGLRLPAADGPLWLNEEGTRLTADGLRRLLGRMGKAAGVAHCHPHTFRRTFALWSLRAGMDVYRLARLMGHADITVLRQYLDLVTDDVQAAHEAAAIVDRLRK